MQMGMETQNEVVGAAGLEFTTPTSQSRCVWQTAGGRRVVKPSEKKVARPGGLEPPTSGLEGRIGVLSRLGLTIEQKRLNTLGTRCSPREPLGTPPAFELF